MIDIHCHLLYGVDDGAKSLEESKAMLREAKRQGIKAIILTPHYRRGMFPFDLEQIFQNYIEVRKYAERVGIRLLLGTEYHMNDDCIQYLSSGRCLTLAGSSYVLTEYSYETEYAYIRNMTQKLLSNGYIPVIAHVERYRCLVEDIENVEELRSIGAYIQVNADAILGLDGRKTKKYTKQLLKEELIDMVASDSHGIEHRVCHMAQCREYISKKYGEKTARRVTELEPGKILAH